jgi:osmotically-inducible protein OsmY
VSPPSGTKGNLVILGGKASNAAELNLITKFVNDAKGVKSLNITPAIKHDH